MSHVRELVTLPPDAYPGAIQAAGELARIGDLAGESAVWAGLAALARSQLDALGDR